MDEHLVLEVLEQVAHHSEGRGHRAVVHQQLKVSRERRGGGEGRRGEGRGGEGREGEGRGGEGRGGEGRGGKGREGEGRGGEQSEHSFVRAFYICLHHHPVYGFDAISQAKLIHNLLSHSREEPHGMAVPFLIRLIPETYVHNYYMYKYLLVCLLRFSYSNSHLGRNGH